MGKEMTGGDYGFWLCGIDGIGIQKIKCLQQEFGTPEAVYRAPEKELGKISGITGKDVHKIVESRKIFRPGLWKEKLDLLHMKAATFFSEDYPAACRQLFRAPKRLFYKGSLPAEKYCVAVVGARDCSMYGKSMARVFGAGLAAAGVAVISGMARGVDGWAHQGALEGGGKTYAVLGNSAEICYPREHRRLYESIIKNGGVLSEYPPGTEARPGFFPMRNRIISALADAVLVVEARKKSGSLITADLALEMGKEVFVIPGRVGDALSEGCNSMIKQGAGLVTEPDEILQILGIGVRTETEKIKKLNIHLETNEKMVYDSLSFEPMHINTLMEDLKMSQIEIMRGLLPLLKDGLVQEIGNHYYIKCN